MSSSDSDLVMAEQVIKGLMLPDNQARKKAEATLQDMMNNKEPLCLVLSRLLITSSSPEVLQYCAIILRKLFIVKDDEISSEIWINFKDDSKAQIKANLLQAVSTCTDVKLQKKICDAIANIYTAVEENEEKWEEILRFIVNGLNLQLNEQNLAQIEVSLYLLAGVYCVAYEQLKEGIPTYKNCFKVYFSSNILSLKAKTVKCINELLCSAMSKKETKQFRDFMFNILETTLHCLNAKDNENLKICLESLNDLSSVEPKILRKSFPDMFILMGKIIQNNEIEDELREMAFEILIALIKGTPKVIEKDEEKLNILIQNIFKYAMEIDNNIDDDWLTPPTEKYIEDEFIPEEKLDEAADLLTRLFDALPDKVDDLLKMVSTNVMELLNHSNEDWRFKYIAYIVIAEIVSQVDDLAKIKDILETIINDANSPHVKVQYACLYCIAEIAEEHNPDFQNDYHTRIIPLLLNILSKSNVLRIQLQVCDALECYVQHMTNDNAALYMNQALELLFQLFLKNSPSSLKQIILNVINEFMDAAQDEFKKYAEKCLNILLDVLNQILTTSPDKNLLGLLLETISTMVPISPELFKPKLIPLVEMLTKIQMNVHTFKDSIANSIFTTWENLIPHLIESHKDKIPAIIESLITLLKNTPEMSIASHPNEKINVEEFFKDENDNKKTAKATLETTETEEYSTFLEILNLFLEKSSDNAVKYMDLLYPLVQTLLKYPNEDIQGESSKTLIWIIDGLSKYNQNLLHSSAKAYISDIITQMEKEKGFTLIVELITTVKEIIDTTKVFLTTPEINALSEKVLGVFNNVEKARISLMKQKEETEKEIENDKKTGANKIYSDDEDDASEESIIDEMKDQIEELEEVETAFNDFFGTLFKTHKELTLELVEKLIKEYLPKYFAESSSTFEKKLGVLILDDMAEFLTQSLLNNIWIDIKNTLCKYADHSDYTLRNAAVYGIGVFAEHTSNNFEPLINDLLGALQRSLVFPKDAKKFDKDNMKFSKDNSVSAIGKIIKSHGRELPDLKGTIQVWIDGLPIVSDNEEGVIMNKFLMEIIEKDPALVLGENYKNLGHIVAALVKGLDTDFCDSDTNAKIRGFINKIKGDATMMGVVTSFVETMKEGKNKNKVKKTFNSA